MAKFAITLKEAQDNMPRPFIPVLESGKYQISKLTEKFVGWGPNRKSRLVLLSTGQEIPLATILSAPVKAADIIANEGDDKFECIRPGVTTFGSVLESRAKADKMELPDTFEVISRVAKGALKANILGNQERYVKAGLCEDFDALDKEVLPALYPNGDGFKKSFSYVLATPAK